MKKRNKKYTTQKLSFRGQWLPYDGSCNPPAFKTLLLVTLDRTALECGIGGFSVNVGYYDDKEDVVCLHDDEISSGGGAVFWAPLPDLPIDALLEWDADLIWRCDRLMRERSELRS